MMSLKDFINIELPKQSRTLDYIELDKSKEIDYMQEHYHRFNEILKSLYTMPDSLKILDIGPTPFTLFLKNNFPNYTIWTLDRTVLLKERLQKSNIELAVTNLDEGIIPFQNNSFDLAIFTEVLEHIFTPPTIILSEIKRILRPSGKMILSVPNFARLSNRIKLFFGISPLPHADNQMNKNWVHGHGHIHEYTKKEIAELCESVGFKLDIVKMISPRPFEFIKGYGNKKDLFKHIYNFISYPIFAFRTQIYVECRNS